MSNQITDDQLWVRIQEIRGSYTDVNKLTNLIEQWETDFDELTKERAKKLIANNAQNYWRHLAKDGNTVEHLIPLLWESWDEGEFTIEKSEGSVQINCTKCPMADAYRSIGRKDLGYFFHCDEDEYMVSGFNPEISFRRTKTLMDSNYCDHFYSLDSS